jgi:hypothetical protein
MAALKRLSNKYTFPQYTILFSDNIAKHYQPIVYSHECLSGPPEAVYYGILSKEETKELCIQYFSFGGINNVIWLPIDMTDICIPQG